MTTRHRDRSPLDTEFKGFADASLVIHSVRSRDELLILSARVVTEMLDAEGSSVVLRDPETGDLIFHIVTGEKSSDLKSFRLAEGEGITGHCVRSASSVIVNDARSDPRFCPRADAATSFTTRSILCVPLKLDGECIGALSVVNKRRGPGFDVRDCALCEAVANQIAVAIRNVQVSRAAVDAARLAAIGQAVAGVAHCMKNLLCGLQGGLYILRKDVLKTGAEVSMRGVEMVERNHARLAGLVQEMLTFSKERMPEYSEVDLNEIVRSVADLVQPRALELRIRLSIEPYEGKGPVELDHDAIHRCLVNLVSNGIDACEGEGTEVRVAARQLGPQWVLIEVTDDGRGMDEATRRCLFQPFFSTKGSRGTGLGLSVTRKIVQEHGGRVEAESEEGKGSTFRIYLPRQRPASNDLIVSP